MTYISTFGTISFGLVLSTSLFAVIVESYNETNHHGQNVCIPMPLTGLWSVFRNKIL